MPPLKYLAGIALVLAALGAGSSRAQTMAEQDGRYTPSAPSQSTPLRVEVIDSTSFRDIETGNIYRLYGIDACAADQIARLGRQSWPCGAVATAWLVKATLNTWLACATIHQQDGVRFARCATATYPDIAETMLRDGVAVNAPPNDTYPPVRRYALAEQAARKSQRGLWSSAFEMPWQWRGLHAGSKPEAAQ